MFGLLRTAQSVRGAGLRGIKVPIQISFMKNVIIQKFKDYNL